jgi:hypothetical protein
MTCKSYISNLAGFFRILHGFHSAAFRKDPIRVFHSYYFVKLHQVDTVGLQSFEGLVNLVSSRAFCAAVDLAHEKHFVAITVTKGLSHTDLAASVMVIPTVIHKSYAAVYGASDYPDTLLFIFRVSDVKTAQPDSRHFLSRASERSINHPIFPISGGRGSRRYR